MMHADEYARRHRAHADATYRKRRNHILHNGGSTSLVPSEPARVRAKRLVDLGWSSTSLEAMTDGISDTTILHVAYGVHRNIERATLAAVMRLPLTVNVPDSLPDTAKVPALGLIRRAQSLQAIGWTHDDMRRRFDVETTNAVREVYTSTTAAKWRAMDDCFEQLHMIPGPSPATRGRALAKGWAPPLAWSDIDDPDEKPNAGKPMHYRPQESLDHAVVERIMSGDFGVYATRAERREIVRRWMAKGLALKDLERETGWRTHRYLTERAA